MRSPLIRALGPAWMAALALVVLAALAGTAAAVLPWLSIPLVIPGGLLLCATTLALLAGPLALAPAAALRASLAAPEGTHVWGTDRPDLWGDLAREAASRSPPAQTAHAHAAQNPSPEILALVKETASVAAALRRDATEATAALHAATLGAARVDGAADHVENRLAHSIRAVEHVSALLGALRPHEAEAIVARAATAVAAVEHAANLLLAAPAAQHSAPAGSAQAAPGQAAPHGLDGERLERALMPLAEAMTRLAARPDLSGTALRQLEAAAATLEARLEAAGMPDLAAVAMRLEDATLPLTRLAENATRLEAGLAGSAARIEGALEHELPATQRALGSAEAILARLEALAETPAVAPVPDTAALEAAVAKLEALAEAPPPVAPVPDTAALEAAVAKLEALAEAPPPAAAVPDTAALEAAVAKLEALAEAPPPAAAVPDTAALEAAVAKLEALAETPPPVAPVPDTAALEAAVAKLEALAEAPPPAAPVPDTAALEAAVAKLEALAEAPPPVAPVPDTAALEAAVAKLEALAEAPPPAAAVPDTAALDAVVAKLEALAEIPAAPGPDFSPLQQAVDRLDSLPGIWRQALGAEVGSTLLPLADRLRAVPEAVLEAVGAGLEGATAEAARKFHNLADSVAAEVARLQALHERLEALPGALAESMAEAQAQSGAVAARLESSATTLESLPPRLEERAAAGAAKLQDAAATLGAVAAEAMTATHRTTLRSTDELRTAAEGARQSLDETASLARQVDAVRASFQGVAERLATLAESATVAVAALSERSLAEPDPVPAAVALPTPPAFQPMAGGTVAGGLLASLREGADTSPPALTAALASLSGVESEAARLLAEAESLAETAASGGACGLPAPLLRQAPAVLDVLDQTIARLRGAATAIALATDSAAATLPGGIARRA